MRPQRDDTDSRRARLDGRWLIARLRACGLADDAAADRPLDASYRSLPRAGRRRLRRDLERAISRQLFSDGSARRTRRRLSALAVGALLGLFGDQTASASVVVQDGVDFVVTISGPDTVVVDCDPVARTVRIESEGAVESFGTRCVDVQSLALDASLSGGSVTIDATALRSSDIPAASLTLIGSDQSDFLQGPGVTDGSLTLTVVGGGGDDTVTIGTVGAQPAQTNDGTITVDAGDGDDTVTIWRRTAVPLATGANAVVDLGEGLDSALVVTDNTEILGGSSSDEITVCGCWADVDGLGGNDLLSSTGFNNVLRGGEGADVLTSNEFCTATATITIGEPAAAATVTLDGGPGGDRANVDFDSASSVTIVVADSGTDLAVGTVTITGIDRVDGASLTLDAAGGSLLYPTPVASGRVDFSGMDDVVVELADQTGPDGDSLTLNVQGAVGYDVAIDGGAPAAGARPGDTLVTIGGSTATITGFETLIAATPTPVSGWSGLFALGASLASAGWARLRRRDRDASDPPGD